MEARNYEYTYEEVYIENTAIPIPQEKVRVRKKVKSKSKTKILTKKFALITFTAVNLFLVAITLQSYMTVSSASVEISKLSNEIEELETTRDYYNVEIGKYSSAERIEEIAKNQLGMYYPEDNQYLYISTENPQDVVK